jgi:hypothetical protein
MTFLKQIYVLKISEPTPFYGINGVIVKHTGIFFRSKISADLLRVFDLPAGLLHEFKRIFKTGI